MFKLSIRGIIHGQLVKKNRDHYRAMSLNTVNAAKKESHNRIFTIFGINRFHQRDAGGSSRTRKADPCYSSFETPIDMTVPVPFSCFMVFFFGGGSFE